MVQSIISIGIFLIPLSGLIMLSGTTVWYPNLLATMGIGFAVASWLIGLVNIPLALISLYSFFSYVFLTHQNHRSFMCVVLCYLGCGIICLMSQLKSTKGIYGAIIGMALLQFALVMAQHTNVVTKYLNKDPFFLSTQTVGFVGSHNQLGSYYAAVGPILFHFCFPLLLVSIVAVYWTHCSTAAVGLIAGGLTYLWAFKLWKVTIIPILVVSCLLWGRFDHPLGAFKERAEIWKLTLHQLVTGRLDVEYPNGARETFRANPWTGFGIGSFIVLSPRSQQYALMRAGMNDRGWLGPVQGHNFEHAHNDLIECLFEFGYIGVSLVLILIWDLVSRFWRARKTNLLIVSFSSLVAQAVVSMGVYVIHVPVSYFMLCLTVGLVYAELNLQKGTKWASR